MIISHKHKFIFIKTQKTAGTSIEIALSKYCGKGDIITPISANDELIRKELGYTGPQNYHIPFSKYTPKNWLELFYTRKRKMFYNHISGAEIKRYIGDETWNSYYKFCFERNPYDKAVSLYSWYGKEFSSMHDFIMSGRAGTIRGFELYTINAMPIVDHIYKFEEIPEALQDISDKLNLDSVIALPEKKAKGNVRKDKRHYREIYNEEEREWIAKIFAREIKYLDYTF